jgi:hypothetical protein
MLTRLHYEVGMSALFATTTDWWEMKQRTS